MGIGNEPMFFFTTGANLLMKANQKFLMYIAIVLLTTIVSCKSEMAEFSNDESPIFATSTQEIVENTKIAVSKTPESVEVIIHTTTPEPMITEEITEVAINHNEIIQSIDEKIYYYEEVYDEQEIPLGYQISSLDFSKFDINNTKDIGEIAFLFDPTWINFITTRDIHILNRGKDLIYITYYQSLNETNLLHYSTDSGIINMITQKDILHAKVTPDGKHITYLTRDQKIYIVDINGFGVEYASALDLHGIPAFSLDGKFMINVAIQQPDSGNKTNEQLILYLSPIGEPNTIEVLGVKENPDHYMPYWYQLTWTSKSKEVYFTRMLDKAIWQVCKVEIETQVETCYSDFIFSRINTIDVSDNEMVVLSGRIESVDLSKCNGLCDDKSINNELFILNTKDNELSKITNTVNTELNAMFIGNGNYIIYQRYIGLKYQIFITDTTGSFQRQLTFCDEDCVFEGY